MATRDRRERAIATVDRLVALPATPPIIVVDDASQDGTADALRAAFPSVLIHRLNRSRGAAARNVGVERASTPYVAFTDDDSWWAPAALDVAAGLLDSHPSVAVLGARVLVGPVGRLDATSAAMAASPLGRRHGLPGPSVLGFLACGAVARRDAVLQVGGFPDGYGVGGEEAPLACALAAAGWDLIYCDDVVAHHHPNGDGREPAVRRRRQTRNELMTAWRYRRGRGLVAKTAAVAGRARNDAAMRRGLLDALRAAPRVLLDRRPVPMAIERQLRLLDRPVAERDAMPAVSVVDLMPSESGWRTGDE